MVNQKAKLRDMNLSVPAGEGGELEVMVQNQPCRGGRQLAVDVTVRSVLTADGLPKARAAYVDGVVADGAQRDQGDAYPELARSKKCELVVVSL